MKISVAIITNNEENNIEGAIQSAAFADEIVVVDSESSDATVSICEKLGARVFSQKWLGFSKQKQKAVDLCTNEWIFSLDADERVSSDLRSAIEALKSETSNENLADGYRFSRLSYYMGKPIKHSGWYPDWQLRLFNRRKGKWKDVAVHESIQMKDGTKVVKIKKDILHYSIENAAHHNSMIDKRYAPLAAKQMHLNGRRTTKFKVRTAGLTSFFESYVLKRGFLDGFPGFCIAKFAAHHSYMKHLLLYELQSAKTSVEISGKSP